ncbi:MAG: class I SAM-dependent methyltransferase [Candidatus Bathyarchaeota archaeon]|nr:MAG: class I SAM-dependent methyltransferase [Candidatus Bathyarchaeota archaeon]
MKEVYTSLLERRLNNKQPPDQVMDAMGVEPGMKVAEVGVGRGRYGVRVALRLGDSGAFYGVDIHEGRLGEFSKRCRREGLGNVVTILGEDVDPRLPEGELDLVFFISTYHHLSDPVGLLRSVKPSLKPGGRLAIVERDPVKSGRPKYEDTLRERSRYEAVSREGILSDADEAGYDLVETHTFLPEDNIYILKPKV